MEAVQDEALAEITAREGMTIGLALNMSNIGVQLEDDDGTSGVAGMAAYASPGVLQMTGLGINTNGTMSIVIDAGGDTSSNVAMLAISIRNPNATTLALAPSTAQGKLQLFNSNGSFVMSGTASDILAVATGTSITLPAGFEINMQLGSEVAATGAFATINANLGSINVGTVNAGLPATASQEIFIKDASAASGASISLDSIQFTNLDMRGTKVDIDKTDGVRIVTGANLTNVGITLNDLTMGATTNPYMGDFYVTGLDVSNQTFIVSGH